MGSTILATSISANQLSNLAQLGRVHPTRCYCFPNYAMLMSITSLQLRLLAMVVEQIQKKYLSAFDMKKAVGFDMIPPKLVKITASVLCQPLSNAIINSLSKGIFPDNAKFAMVSPLDKGTSNKNDISNFRPVSILTTFSKIYERVTKKLIDEVMNKYVSPFISAYRQNYSTQHVLVRLLEEWREGLDNNFVVAGVFMDVSKPLIPFPMI